MDLKSALSSLSKKKEETPEDQELLMERAREINAQSIVVDGHVGTLSDVLYKTRQFGERSELGHVDAPRLLEAGVRCVIMSAFPYDRAYPIRGVKAGLEYVDALRSLATVPGVALAQNTAEIEAAAREGGLALLLSFEGGEFLDASIGTLGCSTGLDSGSWGLPGMKNALADGAAESATEAG